MFRAYDKDGTPYDYSFDIDRKEAISRCGYTIAKPAKTKKSEDSKPASKTEIKKIISACDKAGKEVDDLIKFLGAENIDVITKDDLVKAEDFLNQD